MDRRSHKSYSFLIFTLVLFPQTCLSWSWFSSSSGNSDEGKRFSGKKVMDRNGFSEFSIESLDDPNGISLVERARNKMLSPNSCWQDAYQKVFQGCSKTLADEESRTRLAWHLSDCFQRLTGRPPLPHCDENSIMKKCLKNLDVDSHKIFLEYFLETNSVCHQLQTDVFKHQTERLVNELKTSAEYAETKLDEIERHGVELLRNSRHVHDSLGLIDQQTQQIADTSRNVEDRVNSVLKYSKVVYEQSKMVAASQAELSKSQDKMKDSLEEGMVVIQDSYNNLGLEITKLKNEALEIEEEIGRVGDAMSSKMITLQSKADDIGNMAGLSLDKQKQLLDGQSVALEGLHFLTKYQSQALEESRVTLEKLAEFGHKQQEELLVKQNELYESHDHLVENSKLILAAQQAFESKQASMFVAIDKLFALHSAMLFESRVIIAFLVYSVAIFIIYMLTSVKQAYNVRHRLYMGLCLTFSVEVSILWYMTPSVDHQRKIIYTIRSLFGILASVQYLYAIFTYRDYEVLNHKMLLMLMDKVNSMQGKKEMLSFDMDFDSEVNWSSWVDTDLPEDVGMLEDPDYAYPEEIGDSSSLTCSSTRKYNLRQRH